MMADSSVDFWPVSQTQTEGMRWSEPNANLAGRRKDAVHSQLNWAILLCDVIPDGEKKLSKLRSFDWQ